uniref:Uncharacterized protein n=1 Tax=Anguilla anguilla TaxID=7936 RepID=A0A0E9RVY5_ANGAN
MSLRKLLHCLSGALFRSPHRFSKGGSARVGSVCPFKAKC